MHDYSLVDLSSSKFRLSAAVFEWMMQVRSMHIFIDRFTVTAAPVSLD